MAPNMDRNNAYAVPSSFSNSSNKKSSHMDDILRENKQGMDPNAVDKLLTQELLSLSVRDRNDIQEEIHGVKCLAMDETPELIERSLRELETELEERIPDRKKQAYLKSKQQVTNQLVTQEPSLNSGSGHMSDPGSLQFVPQQSAHLSSSYVNEDEFRLRFLRCDCFNVAKAAKRLVKYLDLLVDLFGEIALQRPIRLSDFTKDELRDMRKGMIQLLPFRDRSGRRIVVFFPEEERSQIPPITKARIAMYMGWVAGSNDVITQRKGLVVMAWLDKSFVERNQSWNIKYKFYEMVSTRISAIHMCSPDTPHYRFRRAVGTMRCGVEYLSKLNFHLGESVEVHYKLQGYGIPTEHIPISWTGKIKLQYLKQWMRIRQAIENPEICSNEDEDDNRSSSTRNIEGASDGNSNTTNNSNIIECPQFQDVIFRQGTSGMCHPGNVTFRSLIESVIMQEEESQRLQKQLEHMMERNNETMNTTNTKKSKNKKVKRKIKRPKQLALEIYEERQRTIHAADDNETAKLNSTTGRYLIWNNAKGWWNEICDREQILMKIEYMVREFQKSSSSKLSRSSLRKKKNSSDSVHNHRKNCQESVQLESETNLFRAQGGGGLCTVRSDSEEENNYQHHTKNIHNNNKRQRLSLVSLSSHEDSYEFESTDTICNAECFGMKFSHFLT